MYQRVQTQPCPADHYFVSSLEMSRFLHIFTLISGGLKYLIWEYPYKAYPQDMTNVRWGPTSRTCTYMENGVTRPSWWGTLISLCKGTASFLIASPPAWYQSERKSTPEGKLQTLLIKLTVNRPTILVCILVYCSCAYKSLITGGGTAVLWAVPVQSPGRSRLCYLCHLRALTDCYIKLQKGVTDRWRSILDLWNKKKCTYGSHSSQTLGSRPLSLPRQMDVSSASME